MSARTQAWAGAALALTLAALPALGQTLDDDPRRKSDRALLKADAFDVDLFAPAPPALIALGISPENSADAGVYRDFDYDVANLSDGVSSGLAIAASMTPYWIGSRDLTLGEYRNELSALDRILARTNISLGAGLDDVEEVDALSLALGVQTQLLDAQDHRFDEESIACVDEAWERYRAPVHEKVASELAARIAEALETGADLDIDALQLQLLKEAPADDYLAAWEQCRDRATARLLARPSWKLGLGLAGRSDRSALLAFDYDGTSAWTSYRGPIDADGRYAYFGFLRGNVGKRFDLAANATADGDLVEAGAGLAYQRPSFRIDAYAAWTTIAFDAAGLEDDEFLKLAGTLDVRVMDGVWVQLSGGANEGSDYFDGGFVSLGLKLGLTDGLLDAIE
ncbi:MAG: hypothetical protein GC199_08430 [Alphaproteobacteria bacterium]|nr:hypothetical protein [Alphaproteobacteria bacterium]